MNCLLRRVGGLLIVAALPARAGELDAQGELAFDPQAVWSESFESNSAASASETALHGKRVLPIPALRGIEIALPLPSTPASHSATLWARGEVFAMFELPASGDAGIFYPTGRMTSDGWIELATTGLVLDRERAPGARLAIFSTASAELDAIELVPEGPAAPIRSCAGAGDKSACTPNELCSYGTCKNVASRVPPLPPAEIRDDLVEYLGGRLRHLFGPFEQRQRDLPAAELELDAMRGATGRVAFWRHWAAAVRRLHDWHTRTLEPFEREDRRPLGACFIEGDADLTRQVASHPFYRDVLVSHVSSANPLGLRAGDRLLSVDGRHPIEWARSLIAIDSGYWTASDHESHAEIALRLPSLIGALADRLEVLRCNSESCSSQPAWLSIAEVPFRDDAPPFECDNRPLLHVAGTPDWHPVGGVFSGRVIESDPDEAIYGLSWSSLGPNASLQIEQAIASFRQRARGLILDHRIGLGGSTALAQQFWQLARSPQPLAAFQLRQHSAERAPTADEGKSLFAELSAAGGVIVAGGPEPRLDLPVALLVHLDGSASDWLALGLKGAPNTRIFGPFPTAGAFSTWLSLVYWHGIGYSLAAGDTLLYTGEMLNGRGVRPDVVVLPLQSDLIAGRDTVYDAALGWVREELAR
jgi:hypothetical protein